MGDTDAPLLVTDRRDKVIVGAVAEYGYITVSKKAGVDPVLVYLTVGAWVNRSFTQSFINEAVVEDGSAGSIISLFPVLEVALLEGFITVLP